MNPLYEMMAKNMPQNNVLNLIQRFQQFRSGFSGNAEQAVRQMLQSGQISQQQYNNAVQMAQQLQKIMK